MWVFFVVHINNHKNDKFTLLKKKSSLLHVGLLWYILQPQQHDHQEEDHRPAQAQRAVPQTLAAEGEGPQGLGPRLDAGGRHGGVALKLEVLDLDEAEGLETPTQVGDIGDPPAFCGGGKVVGVSAR